MKDKFILRWSIFILLISILLAILTVSAKSKPSYSDDVKRNYFCIFYKVDMNILAKMDHHQQNEILILKGCNK